MWGWVGTGGSLLSGCRGGLELGAACCRGGLELGAACCRGVGVGWNCSSQSVVGVGWNWGQPVVGV